MKNLYTYWISTFLICLTLLYSSPIRSLHTCNNLNHSHPETQVEQEHPHCYICDISIFPCSEAIAESSITLQIEPISHSITEVLSPVVDFNAETTNKGPPFGLKTA